mmetsp:Transcript_53294/g.165296  ORF Transcript_53294/g.165296 Transcript_53294/m.165296 type:complete len:332 (-) Transcript_53294:787-1782(-)
MHKSPASPCTSCLPGQQLRADRARPPQLARHDVGQARGGGPRAAGHLHEPVSAARPGAHRPPHSLCAWVRLGLHPLHLCLRAQQGLLLEDLLQDVAPGVDVAAGDAGEGDALALQVHQHPLPRGQLRLGNHRLRSPSLWSKRAHDGGGRLLHAHRHLRHAHLRRDVRALHARLLHGHHHPRLRARRLLRGTHQPRLRARLHRHLHPWVSQVLRNQRYLRGRGLAGRACPLGPWLLHRHGLRTRRGELRGHLRARGSLLQRRGRDWSAGSARQLRGHWALGRRLTGQTYQLLWSQLPLRCRRLLVLAVLLCCRDHLIGVCLDISDGRTPRLQ